MADSDEHGWNRCKTWTTWASFQRHNCKWGKAIQYGYIEYLKYHDIYTSYLYVDPLMFQLQFLCFNVWVRTYTIIDYYLSP